MFGSRKGLWCRIINVNKSEQNDEKQKKRKSARCLMEKKKIRKRCDEDTHTKKFMLLYYCWCLQTWKSAEKSFVLKIFFLFQFIRPYIHTHIHIISVDDRVGDFLNDSYTWKELKGRRSFLTLTFLCVCVPPNAYLYNIVQYVCICIHDGGENSKKRCVVCSIRL